MEEKLTKQSYLFAVDKITKLNKFDDQSKNYRFKIVKRRCLWTKEVLK